MAISGRARSKAAVLFLCCRELLRSGCRRLGIQRGQGRALQPSAIFDEECHVAITYCGFPSAMEKFKALFHAVFVPQYFLTSRRHSRRESWWPSKRALHLLAISIGSLGAPPHKRIIAHRVFALVTDHTLLDRDVQKSGRTGLGGGPRAGAAVKTAIWCLSASAL
ncbi:uncharacterized protein PSANT_07090 [Moesziomyces antarcticus]|uniref:Uncharacterized protein n=1 Tax=Pseudozyma antarctica TaxID=84753 RepID=A0A5C3FY88_PSEA2|nr:uncharacterized protein PSANT_06989 [Moesziomyces antarcticus]SPO49397.1 uncharacterized protein PSANT_07090 [Moesziomyces antarcticus]